MILGRAYIPVHAYTHVVSPALCAGRKRTRPQAVVGTAALLEGLSGKHTRPDTFTRTCHVRTWARGQYDST